MQRRFLFTLAFIFSSLMMFAQGVNFQELTLNEAIAKAKAENKLIFIDGYTTWCGPCKNMTENIFPQKECGDFFNAKFINIKFDMEKGEGIEIKNRFGIRAFPTFLILNNNGDEQYRVVGGGDVEGFIKRVERGLNPKYSLAVLDKEYESGKMKKDRMGDYILTLDDAYDQEKSKKIAEEFVGSLSDKDKYSKKYVHHFLNPSIFPITLENLAYIADNQKKFNKSAGEEKINNYLSLGYNQIIAPFFNPYSRAPKDPTILAKIRENLKNSNLPEKSIILVKTDIATAVVEKNMNQALTLLENNLDLFNERDLSSLISVFYNPNSNDKSLMSRVVALEEPLLAKISDNNNKKYFENLFGRFKPLASTGVYWYDISLEEAQTMAQMTRKLIFLDCYTTWCGPCKHMTENVFPQEEAGDFFNKNFVCIKIDMEKGEGPELGKRFGIRAYPTFLVIRPDGTVQHKILGGGDVATIIKKASEGLKQETSTSFLDKKYENGDRSKDLLASYTKQLLNLYESDKAKEVSNELLAQLSDAEKMSPEFWDIYGSNELSGPGSDNFAYLIKNLKSFIKNVGENKINKKFNDTYMQKAMYIMFGYDNKTTVADIDKMKKEIISYKLPNQAYLISNLEITKAFLNKDTAKLLSTCQKEVKNINDESVNIMYAAMSYLKGKVNDNQKSQFNTLVDSVIKQVTDEQLKEALKKEFK